MKKNIICISLLLLAVLTGCSQPKAKEQPLAETATAPIPFGDPFILLHDGTYYAYGTHSDQGIEVYSSDNLETWKYAGLALNKSDVWADRWFWAPEVYQVNDRFYMYYSADEHICVATSDSPTGPFRQVDKKPMIADEKCIDHSLFIDDDGTPYLFFVRFNDGLNIWVGELENDLITLKTETLRHCIHVSQEWETVWPRVNEGPYVLKHNGTYYMTYSANSYESPFYGIGCATAGSVTGEWTKYTDNPLLQCPGDLVGIGHSAMFTDKDGSLRIVYHAHKDKENIHPRAMYIGRVSFNKTDGPDRMQISKEFITPTLIK